ncbi:response regulator transcription factor [Priestia megaterium]|uniref:Response regulator transcription factor n=1 Tax=Priestia megaterium TaxID=1404 RepID=A0A6H1P3P1_PRIMG|nr:response regulator transcription factor [Priestia megaterium]
MHRQFNFSFIYLGKLIFFYYFQREVAELLFITENTVLNSIFNVIKKLGVKERYQAVLELIRLGELQI